MDKLETYKRHCCPSCGVIYYLHNDFEEKRREDKETFYCPNGHSVWFPSKTKSEKLQEQVEYLKDSLQHEMACCLRASREVEHLKHSRNGMKGKLVQLQKKQEDNHE